MDSARPAVRPVADRREASRVGRRARLELVFARRDGRTVLAHAYAEPPFRIGRTFPDGDGVRVILASSAPGIFGGDDLEQHVVVGPGARVALTSQSALQVHPSPGGDPARLRSTFSIDAAGELDCEWHPVIPFADARLDQRIAVNLEKGALVGWSDALMAGRVASAVSPGAPPCAGGARLERWAFRELAHELRIARAGATEYLERYRLAPRERPVDAAWVAGASCYLGTIAASGWPVEPAGVAALHARLAALAGVRAAADRLDANLCLVRLMSDAGAPFHEARRLARASVRESQKR